MASVLNTGQEIGEDGRIRQKTDALRFSRDFGGDGQSQDGAQIGSFDKIKRNLESINVSNKTNEDNNKVNVDGDDEVLRINE